MSSSKTLRSTGYSIEEDQVLCQAYLEISQDPIIGTNQSSKQFWSRICEKYHEMLPPHINNTRPERSLYTRFKDMQKAVGKLRGCIRQIENLNPSGASEQDIITKAKVLLAEDPKYKIFKFDHVWHLLKDMEKFADNSNKQTPIQRKRNNCYEASQSDSARSDKSIGSSSFCIDLNADFETEEPLSNDAERPVGRKKEKMKKKQEEQRDQSLTNTRENNEALMGMFQKTNTNLEQNQYMMEKNYELEMMKVQHAKEKLEFEKKKFELRARREENKILMKDAENIQNPILRESVINEQIRIYAKRARDQQSQEGIGSSNVFDQYFSTLGGDDDDIPKF